MTTTKDYVAALDRIDATGAKYKAITEGPASGPDSIVQTASGPVKTIARVVNEVPSAQADRVAADASAAAAAAHAQDAADRAGDAAGKASAAAASAAAAKLSADAALLQGGNYPDELTGRLAVADGQAFKVQGAGDIAAVEYRRVSSALSVPIAVYPSASFVMNLQANLAQRGLTIYAGAGPIYPLATDVNGNVILGYDSTTDTIVGTGLITPSSLPGSIGGYLGGKSQADFLGAGPLFPIMVDSRGNVLLGYDATKDRIVGVGLADPSQGSGATRLEDLPAGFKPVPAAVNHLLFYGESTSVGATSLPPISTTQPYGNLTFAGGPRAWSGAAWDFSAFKPLVEDAVSPAPDGGTNRGETGCAGAANYATTLAAIESGAQPSDHVILASTAGHGGYTISQLQKGSAWYASLLGHVSSAKGLSASYAVHAVALVLGINDSAAHTPYANYRAGVEQLQLDVEADIKAITGQASPVFLILNQISYGARTWPDQALAQLDLAQKNSKILLATPSYHFPVASDNIHFTNVAAKWHGLYFGRAYKRLVRDGKRPKWLNPISATRRGAVIRVRFDVPYRPLVIDAKGLAPTPDSGFKVLDGANAATISSLVVDGDELVITLAAVPAGAVTVRYGLDYQAVGLTATGGGSGNLRDSDPAIVAIQGQNYPLYNVCPHFQLPVVALGE